jgi:hypothetical protein
MAEVVRLVIDNPDPAEVGRREEAARVASERSQAVCEEIVYWLEDEAIEARAAYRRARTVKQGGQAGERAGARERLMMAEVRLSARRDTYERLDGQCKAAWDRVLELFGGDYRRYQRWGETQEALRLGMTVEECRALTFDQREALYGAGGL